MRTLVRGRSTLKAGGLITVHEMHERHEKESASVLVEFEVHDHFVGFAAEAGGEGLDGGDAFSDGFDGFIHEGITGGVDDVEEQDGAVAGDADFDLGDGNGGGADDGGGLLPRGHVAVAEAAIVPAE